MIQPSSLDTNLSQLLEEVNMGKMQLPEFQRDWTWDNNRIKGIIASLSQGYPMGAIMRLQYGNPEIKFKYRLLEGVKNVQTVPEHLILDGQQRMTSIYQAVYALDCVETKNEKDKKLERFYYLSISDCMNNDIDRFEAVIDVPKDRKIKKNFDRDIVLDLSDREKEYEHKMFPLNIVYHGIDLMDWTLGYAQYYANDQEAIELFKQFKNQIVDTITMYKLPVITLDKSTPREAVCKVFENVNTGGVALTVFELVTATFASYDFDLREDWNKCRDIIQGKGQTLCTDLMHGVDETTFLMAVTLYTSYMNKLAGKVGTVSCKKRDVLLLNYNDYKVNRNKVLEGFKLAREFLLNYQAVYRRRDLPYTTQLVPLVAICAVLGASKCNQPNTIKILSRWYWCGIFGEMYGGANETRYANDIEDVLAEIQNGAGVSRTENAAFFSSTRLLTLQTRNSAAYKGVMALLYKEKCRDFKNDLTIDIANSMEAAPDIHHIFPEAYCVASGIEKTKYNSIVNKTPILPATNRSIGGNAPSVYTKAILKNVDGITEADLKNRVESHFIDYNLLVNDDFDGYFIDRAKKLLDLIEKAMGKPVSDRDAEITKQQFGATLI